MQSYSDLSVLIIDPNPAMRGNLHNMLNQASVTRIEYAVSSGTAIRQLGNKRFDVILCEYDLGSGNEDNGQDGQQLLEDLRLHKLIDRSTIFIMLTSEAVQSKVMSAAELTPTDYVLKPFTVDVLMQRIARAVDRRAVFMDIYQLIAQGQRREAIAACQQAEGANPRFATDFARLRAEMHMELGELAEAELVYQTLLAGRPLGWAQLGLARCQFGLERYDDAMQTLERALEGNPTLMGAYDLLARTYEAIGQAPQAKKILEDAVAMSPNLVQRLRHLGEVAYETGDISAAEKAFRQVVTKARYSEFRDPEDHVNLVRALVRKGDVNQASNVIRDMERTLRASANTEVCKHVSSALLLDVTGHATEAASELSNAVTAVGMARGLSNQLRMGLVNSCLKHRLDKDAADVVMHMMNDNEKPITMEEAVGVFEKAGRHDLARGVGDKIDHVMNELVSEAESMARQGDHRAAVATLHQALRRTPGNLKVLYAAVGAILRQLDELGWEAPLGEQAASLIGRIRRLDPDSPALEALLMQYAGTQRKYGISTTA
ncbi:MAG: transcriptional regulator [Pseudoduganella sp.]|jgi:tetratricopeptide (TPR) repeat protein/CheY-like chemotaxis protein|nr:transcriptional regulator [Pseudoduganella sp.]